MDLTGFFSTFGSRRAHVLLIEVPGWGETRMNAEFEIRNCGWLLAESAADADVLFVCGNPGRDFSRIIETVWDLLPGPRARVGAVKVEGVARALSEGAALLLNRSHQHQDASSRMDGPEMEHANEGHSDSHGKSESESSRGYSDQGATDTSSNDHTDMDHHSGMDHGGDHGGMDHGGMEMPMPGGIPLAGEGKDRDGLNLDVLNVPLGPVLPHWPAGLVLRCVLQGDVIVESSAEVLRPGPVSVASSSVHGYAGRYDDGIRRVLAAGRCDGAKRLLSLAGWSAASALAERVRDGLLTGVEVELCRVGIRQLSRKVDRSRLLRWSLGGLYPSVSPAPGTNPDPFKRPEAWEELRGWLVEAQALLEQKEPVSSLSRVEAQERAQRRLDSLPALVKGLDVGAARIVVASLDVDTSLLVGEPADAHD